MQAYLDSEYEKLGIEPEFRKFKPKGQLGFITKSDKLAKKGKDFIDSEVNRELAWQNKIEGRIASLEAECLKAGLKSPLSKHHIADFLYNPDDGCFTGRLESVIEAELKREAELIEAAKDEVKEEVKEEVKAEIETQTHHNDINSEPDPNAAFQLAKQQAAESIEPYFEAPKVDPNDKTPTIRMIDAKFKVKVPANVPLEKIEAKIKELLFKAGCNDESLVSIKVSQ